MVDNIVIGGVVVNGFLFALVAFFVQRWMNRVEADRIEDRAEVRRIAEEVSCRAEQTAKSVAEKTAATSQEIKERIEANRTFYATTFTDMKRSIDKLADRVGIQNGRVSKVESDLKSQVKVCEERNKKKKRG